MTACAKNARQPSGEREGAKESEVIENEYPANGVGAGGHVTLHVGQDDVNGDAIGDLDGGDDADAHQDRHSLKMTQPRQALADELAVLFFPGLTTAGNIEIGRAHV